MSRLKIIILSCLWLSVNSHASEGLLDLYHQAWANDPQLKLAEAQRLAIYEHRPQAEAAFWPLLNLGAHYTKEWAAGRSQDNTSSGYAVSLIQPLYNRETGIALSQAGTEIQKAEAVYLEAQQDLITRLSARYFDVLAALDNVKFSRNNKVAIQRQLEQSKQRFEVGLIAITDVHEAQAAYDLSLADEIKTLNESENAQESLREITGTYHESLAPLKETIPLLPPDPEDLSAWVETALKRSPLVNAAQLEIELARQGIDRQRAYHYPQLDLVGQHSYQDVDEGGAFASGYRHSNSISLQFNLPVDIGGGARARTSEAKYRHQQALEGLEKQKRFAHSQVHQAYRKVLSGISRVKALQQAVVSAASAYEATKAGFEVGMRTSVDVLTVQRELLGAQRDYARARYDYVLSTLQLKQAAGILTAEDLIHLMEWFVIEPKSAISSPLKK